MENEKSLKAYRGMTMGAVHTLLALFVLGMIANLYIEMPESIMGHEAWAWVFSHSAVIAAHAVLGSLLVLVAIGSLVMSFKVKQRYAIIASLLGFLFTLLSYYFGSEFVSAGQTNLSSLLMAFGFLGALVSYATGVMKAKIS